MELEFDKEMDALLRRAAPQGVLVGDTAKLHLDADAIAAFAENALPEKSRRIYTEHLAECDPCRKTLSNLILLNAETEPELAAAAAPVAAPATVPWYRKLLTTPNLAYTFGGLILFFSGLIGFVVFQNMRSREAMVSQVQDTETSRSVAPAVTEPMAATSNSNASANAANTSSNAAGEIPRSLGTSETGADADGVQPPSPPVALASPGAGTASAAPTKPVDGVNVTVAQPAPKELAKSADEENRMRVEDKRALNEQENRKQENDARNVREQQLNQNMPGAGNTKDSGPSRMTVQRDNRAYDDATTLKAKKAPETSTARSDSPSGRRQAGGKTFEQKQGAWYDTTYRGQSTKNVRRNTDEYRKLDGGLRSIVDRVGGTVVVVWNGKAYRIQ